MLMQVQGQNFQLLHTDFFFCLPVLLVPFLLNKIPYASLAAILLVTGYNLTNPKLFRNMWSLGWKQFIPFAITIIVILSTDLLIGVSIGFYFNLLYCAEQFQGRL